MALLPSTLLSADLRPIPTPPGELLFVNLWLQSLSSRRHAAAGQQSVPPPAPPAAAAAPLPLEPRPRRGRLALAVPAAPEAAPRASSGQARARERWTERRRGGGGRRGPTMICILGVGLELM